MSDEHAHESTAPASQAVCYRHPRVPTGLACNECERPICVECSHDAVVGQKCPECAKPVGRNRVVDGRRIVRAQVSWQDTPFTFGMIAAVVGIYLIDSTGGAASFVGNLIQVNFLIDSGEWWRIFTAALLHGGLIHIFFNMYILYLLGPRLESQVGTPAFATMYVACAGAGGATYFVMTGIGAPGAVGASGAIFGLFGAWLFVYWKIRHTPAGRAAFNQFGALILINLALPFFIPNIAWQAHLGGLGAGLAIAWLWSKLAVGRTNAVAIRTAIAAVFVIASVIVVLTF